MKISLKHKKLVDEYLSNGMNKSQAMVTCGYTSKYVNTNVTKIFDRPEVKLYINEQQSVMAVKKQIDREYIVDEYLQLLQSAKTEGLDGGGMIKDRTNWAKALIGLSKLLGLDAPDQHNVNFNIQQPPLWSDEDNA